MVPLLKSKFYVIFKLILCVCVKNLDIVIIRMAIKKKQKLKKF